MSPTRALRWLALLSVLAAATAACGPAGAALPTALPAAEAAAGSASGGTGAGAASGAASPLPSGALTDPAEAWPAYAACLRAHGLEVADPVVDTSGDPDWTGNEDFKKRLTPTILADCGPIIAAVTESGQGRQRATYSYASELAHAACMRDHGLADWPDPDANDLEGGMPPGYDKADPTVYAGLVACERLLVETTASPSPAP